MTVTTEADQAQTAWRDPKDYVPPQVWAALRREVPGPHP
jgi:hypothetical protein